ncbi:hypothetical protein MJQ72_41600 [Amycolatopsis sp. EV170708-02-1]|nr:hypothetical protein MJQ72_41600 [Amycolatopsis sp. EV170708-02-1]
MPALQEDARIAVKNGVKKDNLDDARKYIDDFLRPHKQLADCKPAASSTSTPPASSPPPASSASPSTPASPSSANQPAGRDCSTPAPAAPGGGN